MYFSKSAYSYFKQVKARSGYFFLLCLLAIALRAASQTPGYMGKRLSVGYGAYLSPGAISSNNYTDVNALHEGFLEFAVSKKASLGLSAKYYKTGVNNEGGITSETFFLNGSYRTVSGEPRGFTSVKGLNYVFYAKLFKRNYLAPWGKYFMIGATLNTYVASYDPSKMYISYTSIANTGTYQIGRFSDFGPERQSSVKFDITFGNGRSRIIADRIIVDYGYNINVWAATTLIDDLLERDNSKNVRASDYIEKLSSKRVRGVNRFSVFLKVGVLLF
jgi:hypothetical protein